MNSGDSRILVVHYKIDILFNVCQYRNIITVTLLYVTVLIIGYGIDIVSMIMALTLHNIRYCAAVSLPYIAYEYRDVHWQIII